MEEITNIGLRILSFPEYNADAYPILIKIVCFVTAIFMLLYFPQHRLRHGFLLG